MFETNLYTVIQAHKTQSDWTPPKVPALWKKFYTADVIPEWIQPTGAHDAYNIGDRVIYKDTIYVSAINGNVWSPVAYPAGWTVVKEIVKIDTVEKIDLTIKK